MHELKENGNTKIVLAQWFLIIDNGVFLTFGVSCRENLLGQIPRNCVSMAFLCSKLLERTKLSGVQNHSPKFGGIFWVVGNYPKWRLREKVQKKRAKILSMSGLDFGRERFVQFRGCPWHPQCLPCLVQMRFGRSHPRTGRFFCSADRAFFSAEKSGLTKTSVCASRPKENKLLAGYPRIFAGISRRRPKNLRKTVLVPRKAKKNANTQTTFSQDCPGIIPRLSWDCPDTFLRLPRNFLFMCFLFCPRERQHINKVDPHPFPGQSRKIGCVSWLFVPQSLCSICGPY